MLKDMNDIKLQLTSSSYVAKAGEGGEVMIKLEADVKSLKTKLQHLQEDLENGNLGTGTGGGKKKIGLDDEVSNIWSFL
jgi:hypothetical protein